jgi:hypothetical protein
MFEKNIEKKSPLEFRPLRQPGQSLDEKIQDIIDDKIGTWLVMSIFVVFTALYQWYEKVFKKPPVPLLWTVIAIGVLSYSIFKFISAKRELSNYKLGRDGEREVGHRLEALRENGYHIFHDLIGDNFNVDHVIIGPAGVFTIETKTWRKPRKGQAIVNYDGEKIRLNGGISTDKPIIQARAQRDWLQKVVLETSGVNVPVKAVVVYPNWFINSPHWATEVWVLEPKALLKYLNNEKQIFDLKEVQQIAFQLSRYIRAKEERKA